MAAIPAMPLGARRPLGARTNRLLAHLPDEAFERLKQHLEPHPLALDEIVYEAGQCVDYLYFPTTAIVSLIHIGKEGDTAEMAVVGFEGAVGVALFMGGKSMPYRLIVQGGGDSFRIRNGAVRAEFERGGAFHHGLLRYTQALMVQIAQTAVCNRHHTLEQQLCRWLLLTDDRTADGAELMMTHEMISHMLGVRRAGVTSAAKHLSDLNLISYARGHISLADRAGIEGRVCECYKLVRQEYNRLLD